jgi:hypothetical protein
MARIEASRRAPQPLLVDVEEQAGPPTPTASSSAPTPASRSLDSDLFGQYMVTEEQNVDELTRYVRMAAADIGDDSDLREWWKTQVFLLPILKCLGYANKLLRL